MVVKPWLLGRVHRERVPEDDVAMPDAGDNLLDDALAEESLGIGNGGNFEGVEVDERRGGISFFVVIVVLVRGHAHGET